MISRAGWGGRIVAGLAFGWVGACATPPRAGRQPAAEAAASIPAPAPVRPSAVAPHVLVVTSDVRCEEEKNDTAVAQLLHRDAEALPTAFARALGAPGAVQNVANPDVAQLEKAVKAAARNDRGLVLVYSGHGTEVTVDGYPQTALCIREGPNAPAKPLPASSLLGWLDPSPPAWAFVVLSACHSSFVDLSRHHYRISALTVSPEDIREWAPEKDEPRTTTHVAAAVEAALGAGAALDDSCDGWVSDRELSDAIAGWLWGRIPFLERSQIMPRLRRQAYEPLQLWQPAGGDRARCAKRIDDVRRALLPEGVAELDRRLAGRAADTRPRDYFVLAGAKAGQDCSENPGRLAELCRELEGAGWTALPLREPGAGAARRVARAFDFAEVYEVVEDDAWMHVDRLRDDRRVVTRRERLTSRDLSLRDGVLARWPLGDFVARFTGPVPVDETDGVAPLDSDLARIVANKRRIVAVCPEREGQCFYVPANGVVSQEGGDRVE